MVGGVLVNKLELHRLPGEAEKARARERLDMLFQLSLLKLSLFLYHPNELARRMRYIGQLPQAADLRMLFIYRKESAAEAEATKAAIEAAKANNRGASSTTPAKRKRRRQRPRADSESATVTGSSRSQTASSAAPSSLAAPSSEARGARKWLRSILPRAADILDRFSPSEESEEEPWYQEMHDAASSGQGQPASGHGTGQRRASGGSLRTLGDDADASDEEESDIELGEDLHWRLDGLVGQGSQGLVYKGYFMPRGADRDPSLRVPVAIKHVNIAGINPHLTTCDFEKVVAVFSLTEHPNLMSYFGSHVMNDECFMFMEFCEGGNLHDYIARKGPVRDPNTLAFWARQIITGLEFLHCHGIVHRDIKPSNILIKKGILKISDFSSAKTHGLCCNKVHDARVVGTPSYIAPESNQAVEVKGAQDIWSAGCVLYEVLMGRPPFSEIDNVWTLYYILGRYAELNIEKEECARTKLKKLFDFRGSRVRSHSDSAGSTVSIGVSAPTTPTTATSATLAAENNDVFESPTLHIRELPAMMGSTMKRRPSRSQSDLGSVSEYGGSEAGSVDGPLMAGGGLSRFSDDLSPALPPSRSSSVGLGDLFGARHNGQYYRSAGYGAIGVDPAHSALVTPVDEVDDPFAAASELSAKKAANSVRESMARRPSQSGHSQSPSGTPAHDPITPPTSPPVRPPPAAAFGSTVSGTSESVLYTSQPQAASPGTLEELFPMVKNYHPLLSQIAHAPIGKSPSVLDFMGRFLAWDPRKRATATQLLLHPFVRDAI